MLCCFVERMSQALGGSEQLLACCMLSTLDELVTISSQGDHPLRDWLGGPLGGRVVWFLSQVLLLLPVEMTKIKVSSIMLGRF